MNNFDGYRGQIEVEVLEVEVLRSAREPTVGGGALLELLPNSPLPPAS